MDDFKTLDFYEALKAVAEGRRITKLEWNDKRSYGFMRAGLLELHKAGETDDKFHAWILNDGDLGGLDWIVLEDKPKVVTQVVN